MLLLKKLINFRNKQPKNNKQEIVEKQRFYIPCKDFFLHFDSEESKINKKQVLNKERV